PADLRGARVHRFLAESLQPDPDLAARWRAHRDGAVAVAVDRRTGADCGAAGDAAVFVVDVPARADPRVGAAAGVHVVSRADRRGETLLRGDALPALGDGPAVLRPRHRARVGHARRGYSAQGQGLGRNGRDYVAAPPAHAGRSRRWYNRSPALRTRS